MVVFTCNNCGESLQKPKVEKHYSFVCRRQKSLTCVDCLKDFVGEEYSLHIKCVTEEERYAAKGSFQNGNVKKGEIKQELWSDTIRSILTESSKLSPKCRNLLNHIASFSNVPRKKPKFMNFIKSSMGGRMDYKLVEEVWDIIEEYKLKDMKPASTPENAESQDSLKRKHEDTTNGLNQKTKKLKSKSAPEEIEISNNSVIVDENDQDCPSKTFDFKEEILKVLAKKQSISVNKLEKKMFKKYSSCGEPIDSEKFKKRLKKKLKKIPNVVIDEEKVSLVNQ